MPEGLMSCQDAPIVRPPKAPSSISRQLATLPNTRLAGRVSALMTRMRQYLATEQVPNQRQSFDKQRRRPMRLINISSGSSIFQPFD